MADIVVYNTAVLKVSEKEWKLLMKSLAYMAGITAIKPTAEDRQLANEMNQQFLAQRRQVLLDQLKVAEGAIERAQKAEAEAETVRHDI